MKLETINRSVSEITGGDYLVIGAADVYWKMTVQHVPCGTIYETGRTNFLYKGFGRCPICEKKGNPKQFLVRFREVSNGEYTVLSDYRGMGKDLEIRHDVCGTVYTIRPNNFINQSGSRCPTCQPTARPRISVEPRIFIWYAEQIGYTVVSAFIAPNQPVRVHRIKCGHEYDIIPEAWAGKKRKCLVCGNVDWHRIRRDTDLFRAEVAVIDASYSVIGEYVDNKAKILMMHSCGNEFMMRPNDFLSNENRCPLCSSRNRHDSLGVRSLRKMLEDAQMQFTEQVGLPGCRLINPLRFDFAIRGDDENIVAMIEFDGIQHYKASFGKSSHTKQVERDRAKDIFCRKAGIPLIRIRYDDCHNVIVSKLENVQRLAERRTSQATGGGNGRHPRG